MLNLTPGQPVEVHCMLLSNGAFLAPTKVWASGYVFEGFNGELVVVRQVKKGLFNNCLINYALEDVRGEIEGTQT